MAKKSTLENGLTPKLNTVLEAVKSSEAGATANELFAMDEVAKACGSINSVRSSLARLDKTEGLIDSKVELDGEKTVKRYITK